jgi:hypothetical protein
MREPSLECCCACDRLQNACHPDAGAPPAPLLCAPVCTVQVAFIQVLSSPQLPPCAPAPFSAINTKPRADVWLAGRIILQLSSLSGIYMF